MTDKPFVWQMIKEAVESMGGQASNSAIKQYIKRKYSDVNENTIAAQINICTVNAPGRVHYEQNKRSRKADSQYDFLFNIGRGQVELYDPVKHGVWEIREGDNGQLIIAQETLGEAPEISTLGAEIELEAEGENLSFPFESHLRDFIAKNLDSIRVNGKRLRLYTDEHDRDGIEYPTGVGPIDILATDEEGSLVVFELKLSKGTDRAVGQIMRYLGWVKKNLARGKQVKGVIVAQSISEELKYAVSVAPEISLFEYELSFSIKPANLEP